MQTPQMTTTFAQPPLWVPKEPAELFLHCRRPYCRAIVTLQLPHCALIRMQSYGFCFENAQRAYHRSEFHAMPQRLLAMPLHCCSDVCYRTTHTSAFCIFLGHSVIAMRMLLWTVAGIYTACADPDSFVRGSPTLMVFFGFLVDKWRKDPNTTISGPSSAHQQNAI